MQQVIEQIEVVSLLSFTTTVLFVVLYNWKSLFLAKHGRRHRITGIFYFALLVLGAIDSSCGLLGLPSKFGLKFDATLGIFGILIAVTAALDFGPSHDEKKFIHNKASGTLEEHATVTKGEMWEHSFYQFLLFSQILYIHLVTTKFHAEEDIHKRLFALFFVTLPWSFRSYVPINSFSKNYSDTQQAWTVYGVLYRIKKYQYVALKHLLIHGLNITLAITGGHENFVKEPYFRFFWMNINFSYTMEFFLQTLVKKNKLNQEVLLTLQKILMTVGTVGGIPVLLQVNLLAASTSCCLNFINRGYELTNVFLTTSLTLLWVHYGSVASS